MLRKYLMYDVNNDYLLEIIYIGKIGLRDNLFIIIRLIGEKLSARKKMTRQYEMRH